MKKPEIIIGTPVLRISTAVSHATPRKPTAFERVILSIAGRFEGDEDYGRLTLGDVFEHVLGVPDPGPLVIPTLDELLSLDVIRCSGDSDRLSDLVLEDIEITERGERMVREDMLPAKSMREEETFFYDPIAERLLSRAESIACGESPPEQHLDASLFEKVFPENLIREELKPSQFSWCEEVTIIEQMEPEEVTILWKSNPVSFSLSEGALTFESSNQHLLQYLRSLPRGEVVENLVSPAFSVAWHEEARLSELPRSGELSGELKPLSLAMETVNIESRIFLIRQGCPPAVAGFEPKAGQTVLLSSPGRGMGSVCIEWNKESTGCLIRLPESLSNKSCIFADGSKCLTAYLVEARWGEDECVLVTGKWQKAEDLLAPIVERVVLLIEENWDEFDDDERDAVALLTDPSDYLDRVIRQINGDADDPFVYFEEYSAVVDRLCRKNILSSRASLAEFLADGLIERLPSDDDASLQELKQLVGLLADKKAFIEGHATRIQNELSRIFPSPENAQQYNALIQLLKPLDNDWSPDFPSHTFGPTLASRVLDQFPKEPHFAGRLNVFAKCFVQLLTCRRTITDIIGNDDICVLGGDRLREVVGGEKGKLLTKTCRDWLVAYDKIEKLSLECGVEPAATPVGTFRKEVERLSVEANKLTRLKREKGKSIQGNHPKKGEKKGGIKRNHNKQKKHRGKS